MNRLRNKTLKTSQDFSLDLESVEEKIDKKIFDKDFFEMIDLHSFEASLKAFKDLTGVDVEFVLLDGKILLDTNGENLCRRFHRKHPELKANCFLDGATDHLNIELSKKNKVEIKNIHYSLYECNNLVPFAIVPIYVKKKHIGNIIVRNFFIEGHLEPYRLIKQARKAGFDEEYYLKVIKNYAVLSTEKFNMMMKYLNYLSEMLGNLAYARQGDEELKKELLGSYEELNTSYEELVAVEEELRDQLKVIKDQGHRLQATEDEYRQLYERMSESLAIHELIFDEEGNPVDYRFLKVNESFERVTGLKAGEIIGKTALQVFPDTESFWIEKFGEVVKKSLSLNIEEHSKALGRYYNVKAYKLKGNKFVTLTTDITERKKAEKQNKRGWFQTVASLGELVERRDAYTAGHQKNVAILARRIGEEMELDENRLEGLYLAGLLHDIGKIQIASEILTKPTKLLVQEFDLIKIHPESGYDVLKNIDFPWDIPNIVRQHHEKLDGSGYPNGLKGDEILLESRILAVADIVEAISSHRPYRPALGVDFAAEEMEKGRGITFDPDVVDAFMRIYKSNRLPSMIVSAE